MCKLLLSIEELYIALKSTLQSQIETEIEVASQKDSRFCSMLFPIDVNSNFYCDVLEEAFEKMSNLLQFVVNVIDSEQEKLTSNYVVRCANLIVDILCCKDKRHSAMKKIFALHLMFNKSTVHNLKTFALKGLCAGYTETSRLIEDLAELSDFFKGSQYTLDLGMQITADNVDCMMKGNLEHWMLAYSRLDPVSTKGLSVQKPDFNIRDATHEIVYLSNKELEHLSECCRKVLVRKLQNLNVGFKKLSKFVPYEPLHAYPEMLEKQEVFMKLLSLFMKWSIRVSSDM